MFGLGKKKEMPLKEQPGYGTAKHYYDYAIGEIEKIIKKYGINKKKCHSIVCTPEDHGCLLTYWPSENTVLLSFVNDNGCMGRTLLALGYTDGKINNDSFFGDSMGAEIERDKFQDGMYELASSEVLLPAYIVDAKTLDSRSFEATNQKIKWQGNGYNMASLGGVIGIRGNLIK